MLGDVAVSPVDAAHRLRSAAVDGRLEALADAHGLSLVVLFGSASRGQPDARDLDIAVGARARTGLDVLAVICALMDWSGSDRVDLLDLDLAGPEARKYAPGTRSLTCWTSTDRVSWLGSRMRASGQRARIPNGCAAAGSRVDGGLPMYASASGSSIVQARLSVMRGRLDDLANVVAVVGPSLCETVPRHGVVQ